MSYIAAGVAVAGLATSAVGSMNAGNAARKAAGEQEAAAQDWQHHVADQENQAIGLVKSPAQMAAFDTALRSQEQNVRRQEELVKNLDPALIEAGKQTKALLDGKSAPVLANLQAQRGAQRQQFVNDLTAKYGPGAMSSAIGMQQLQKFDLDTSNILNQAQQGYLEKVSGLSLAGANVGQTLSAVNNALADINTKSPDAQAADLMARFTGAQGQAESAVIQSAGADQVGAEIQGQALGQIGGSLTTLGALGAGSQLKTAQPQATPGTPQAQTPGGAPVISQARMQPSDISGAPPGGPSLGQALPQRSAGVGIPSYGQTNPASSYLTGDRSNDFKTLGYAVGAPNQNYGNIVGGQ